MRWREVLQRAFSVYIWDMITVPSQPFAIAVIDAAGGVRMQPTRPWAMVITTTMGETV